MLKPDTLTSQIGKRFFGFQMNEIERALGRLKKALDQLKDKLDNNMSASFLDDSDQSGGGDVNAQVIDLAELKSIKSQISNAISSPSLSQFGCSDPIIEPPGLPVAIMSPGARVRNPEM